MKLVGTGSQTYLYLNGLSVEKSVSLGNDVELQPVKCSPNPDDIITVSKSEIDIGVAAIFLRSVESQLFVQAETPKALAIKAWNTIWDVVLLSALHNTQVECNLQCSCSADSFSGNCDLRVVHYHLRGANIAESYTVRGEELVWLEVNFKTARDLLDNDSFRHAVHCLSSYRWHGYPSAQLAILWSGIESLFRIESELAFRLSLYTARFLYPTDKDKCKSQFENTKLLYKKRSIAVHGGRINADLRGAVTPSAELLRQLVIRCIELRDIPKTGELIP